MRKMTVTPNSIVQTNGIHVFLIFFIQCNSHIHLVSDSAESHKKSDPDESHGKAPHEIIAKHNEALQVIHPIPQSPNHLEEVKRKIFNRIFHSKITENNEHVETPEKGG